MPITKKNSYAIAYLSICQISNVHSADLYKLKNIFRQRDEEHVRKMISSMSQKYTIKHI